MISGTQSPGTTYGKSLTLPIPVAARYVEDITFSLAIRNGLQSTTTSTYSIATSYAGRTMRIDTVSNESLRVTSGGSLTYPTSFGNNYVSETNINTGGAYSFELQLLNGQYRRLSGLDYGTNYPVPGPNYSTDINASSVRWATFSIGSISSRSGFTFTINQTVSLTTNVTTQVTSDNISSIQILTKISSTSPSGLTSSYWINANSPFVVDTFPGTSLDGQAGMLVGNSQQVGALITKSISLGTNVWTGPVYVRIGLNGSSTARFTGVTLL